MNLDPRTHHLLERIAKALERIADALEKAADPEAQPPRKPDLRPVIPGWPRDP